MALPQGVDFRATAGFVTDPANCTYEISQGLDYPTTSPQGNNIGLESGGWLGGIRDRNAGIDPRLAGVQFSVSVGSVYRIDLPAAGSYNVRLATGDYGSYGSQCAWDLYDGSTNLHSLTTGSTSAAQRWKDAQNVEYNATTWPTSNSPYAATFSTTILRVQATNSASIAHLYVEAAGGGGTPATVTPAGVQATSAVGIPTATGAAIAKPSGNQASSAIGVPTAKGAAIAVPAGVQAASSVGTPVATGGTAIPATVYPAGVQATSAVGTPVATASAQASPQGVQATSQIGVPTATGGALAYLGGVQARSFIGMPSVQGAAIAYAAGVQVQSYIGVPVATGQPVEFGAPLIVAPTPRNWTSSSLPRNWAAGSTSRNWTATTAPRNWTATKD